MNKLQKIQKALLLLLKKPSLINLILNNDYKWEGKLKKNSQPKTLPVIKINDLITSSKYGDFFRRRINAY